MSPQAPREPVGVRIDLSPCDHGIPKGSIPACEHCLQGHRQDCGIYAMTEGRHTPQTCNCGKSSA